MVGARIEGGAPDDPPAPKEPEKRSFAVKLVEVVLAFAVVLVVGSLASYSLRIGRGPWAWTQLDWSGYMSFSQEHAQSAKDRIQEIDWANAKTKITDNTKALWSDAPDVLRRIEERLGIAQPAPGGGQSGASIPRPATSPTGDQPPELTAGLAALRAGIDHYRASPQDPNELSSAKRCFEDAQVHLEKAVQQVRDERQRAEVQDDLKTCNKYLEDCRTREKG